MVRSVIKTAQNARRTLQNFKVTLWERSQIKRNAEKYAAGNVSEWCRCAAIYWKPPKSMLVPLDEQEPDGIKVVTLDTKTEKANVYDDHRITVRPTES